MKKIFLLSLVTFISITFSFAQVAINADGSLPNSSAMLDVSSTSKGFLPPRMTMAQRDLISGPATGIIVYQTDNITGLYVNKGTTTVPNWLLIGPAVPVALPSFFFSTDTPVSMFDYVGLGSSGSNFLRYTIVVPVDCVLKSISFSTRGSFISFPTTATVLRQTTFQTSPQQTTLSATIVNGNFSVAGGNVAVNTGDLISVQINGSSSFLSNGVAVSVSYQ